MPVINKPSDYFNVVTDTGANILATAQALYPSNSLVWIKDRANANNHQLIDNVRGSSAVLQSNSTAAETTYTAPSGNSVAWVWRAGGAAVANNAGSIAAQVSAGLAQGFSVVTYTGTGAAATVGHGLGVAPKMVIVKKRGAVGDWPVYHSGLTSASYCLFLDGTNAQQTDTPPTWNNTSPTSSVFSIGSNSQLNVSGIATVAYCFSEVAGYSKFGSYVGNGSADGPFVYCGFRPRYVMVKMSSSTGDWRILDTTRNTFNAANSALFPNLSDAEASTTLIDIDITSNGFKLRNSLSTLNASGGTYIFMAFAEAPQKFSLAR